MGLRIFEEDYYRDKITIYVNDYCGFMGIDSFPKFNIEFFELDLDSVDKRGFGGIAQANYKADLDIHTLYICKNFEIYRYIIYHELTHIMDAEKYAKRNKVNYAMLSGYTEYHASQIELLCLLGAKCDKSIDVSFSVEDVIDTFCGQQTVREYALSKHNAATEAMRKEDFPRDLDTLIGATGALYNYWGLRSICEMYSDDFIEQVDNTIIKTVLDAEQFDYANMLMKDWFDQSRIMQCFMSYYTMVLPKAINL